MPRRIVFACLIVAAVTPLAGCGQKGPLTLPPAKPAVVAPAPAATAVQPAATTPASPASTTPAAASSAG